MLIVDTHCHTTPIWYEPVESLLFQMDRNEVEKAVLVQIKGYYDNEYQFECVERYPDRLSSVVNVDVSQPSALKELERCVERGAAGVRLDVSARSPGEDPLAIWRKAEELGIAVSCAGRPRQLISSGFIQIVEQLPNLSFIIEHLGAIKAWDPPTLTSMHEGVYGLAKYPNVYMKIHGLGEFCGRNLPVTSPFPLDRSGLRLLRRVYNAYGPERLMWGSDYPPVSGREGYANALKLTMAEFDDKSEAERAVIFGGTAMKLFGLAKSGARVKTD